MSRAGKTRQVDRVSAYAVEFTWWYDGKPEKPMSARQRISCWTRWASPAVLVSAVDWPK